MCLAVALWCVVCGAVLTSGRVLAPCCSARCCAGSCCAGFVVLPCPVLSCACVCSAVFFIVGPCLSVVLRMVSVCVPPWCVLLFGVALLCWCLLPCAVWCCVVRWRVSLFCAASFVLLRLISRSLPQMLPWRVLVVCHWAPRCVLCCAACTVLCCISLCRVSWRLFCGAVLGGAAVPALFLPGRCFFACLALAGAMCCCLLFLGVCCWVSLSAVVSSWCVSVSLSLSGRVACCPVVCCGVSWCSSPLCCVLWCCASLWCCAVVRCCLLCLAAGVGLFSLPLKPPRKTRKNRFPFFRMNEDYTQRNTRASSRITNIFLTYLLPVGLQGVVVEDIVVLRWSLFLTLYSEIRTLISILELAVELVVDCVVARA